ncbi:MAG: hypothetical protein V4819_02190 [Verrucomicrobiota bacterium]
MSAHAIHLRSYSPDLKVEFDLPPGTHARIGASPASEVTLPLTGIAPFWCMIGRFQNGRLFLADPNGLILRRFDLPETLSLPPYQFVFYNPADAPPEPPPQPITVEPKKPVPLKMLSLVTGIIVVAALAAVFAVGQCGKPVTVTPPAPPAPKQAPPPVGKPTPVTPAPK